MQYAETQHPSPIVQQRLGSNPGPSTPKSAVLHTLCSCPGYMLPTTVSSRDWNTSLTDLRAYRPCCANRLFTVCLETVIPVAQVWCCISSACFGSYCPNTGDTSSNSEWYCLPFHMILFVTPDEVVRASSMTIEDLQRKILDLRKPVVERERILEALQAEFPWLQKDLGWFRRWRPALCIKTSTAVNPTFKLS